LNPTTALKNYLQFGIVPAKVCDGVVAVLVLSGVDTVDVTTSFVLVTYTVEEVRI
jgi:hypothetical protein